jgi:hypothetical protein
VQGDLTEGRREIADRDDRVVRNGLAGRVVERRGRRKGAGAAIRGDEAAAAAAGGAVMFSSTAPAVSGTTSSPQTFSVTFPPGATFAALPVPVVRPVTFAVSSTP